MRAARALLVSTVTTAVVVAGAGAAQARPVQDSPVECGPGSEAVGARCVELLRVEDGPTLGEIALAVGGALVLVVLW